METAFVEYAARLKERLPELAGGEKRACIGLDGFVDRILYVVDQRTGGGSYRRMETMEAYGRKIAGAAGLSMNVELVPISTKPGGNGVIMAQAASRLGVRTTCIGAMGKGELHPVFQPLGKEAALISYAEPARTDALEFLDGKIISSTLQSLNEVTWNSLAGTVGTDTLVRVMDEADLIALNNWTMIPDMTEIWRQMLLQVFPRLEKRERLLFFDLADPSKRTAADTREAIDVIGQFEAYGETALSCNVREAERLMAVLELPARSGPREDAPGKALEAACRMLRKRMGISLLVIHTLKSAVCCRRDRNGADQVWTVPGNYASRPVLTTGGGDNFNAGTAFGLLHGLEPDLAVFLGNVVSGYYVRHGESPAMEGLTRYLDETEEAPGRFENRRD